jgi:hypothetical protein
MEERRFDELTRVLGAATTRRQVLKGMLGAAVGAVLVSTGLRAPRPALAALADCGGVTYDPTTQCCEPAGPQPRYPIADLALCPNRVPHPGHVPEFNGCGPAGGIISHIIPNRIGPFRNIDFTPACNNHDICYDTCNSVKSTCDQNFLSDLRAACAQAYPGRGYFDRYMRAGCQADAYIYYTAVSQTKTGTEAYESAQKQACDCCAICEECGGSGDERCCQGVCHDPCEEGQQRNPDTCACDPCFGQEDGTTCGTSEVCCQQSCVNDQCPPNKTFNYGECGCVCQPVECPDGEHQDPDTCECVQACTESSCGECQTCDTTTGECVPATDNTACGTDQVCCGGFCLDSCDGPLCPSGQFACAITPTTGDNNSSRGAYICCDDGAACCGGTGYFYDICTGSTVGDSYVCCKNGTSQCGTECCDHMTEKCLLAPGDGLIDHCCPADSPGVLPDGTCCDPGTYTTQCADVWVCCASGAETCC